MKGKRILLLMAIFLFPAVLVLTQCNSFSDKAPPDPRGRMYAGAQTCVKCHKNINDVFVHTAHAQSTQVANAQNVKGSFSTGENSFTFRNGDKVVMDKRADGLYQVWYAMAGKSWSSGSTSPLVA